MKIFTLFALLIAVIAVVFALQNSALVFVRFFGWQVQESMALVLLLTFALGVLFGFLISMPPVIQRMRKIAHLKRKVDEQAYDLESVNHRLTETTTQLTSLQSTPPLPPSNTALPNYPSEQIGGQS